MQDGRRFLRAVYRVGDLDRTITFYTQCYGMQLLIKEDIPEETYSYAIMGFGPEDTHFVLKLIYNYGVDTIDIGTGFGHFEIITQDVYKMVEDVRAMGGVVTREPGPSGGGGAIFAFVQDLDGYSFELTQRAPTPAPLSQIMLQVTDMDRAINFYEKALGMTLFFKYDMPQQFTLATIGYGIELETTVRDIRYNYGITEYTKGNGYSHVAISTDDLYKSFEAVKLAIEELGGEIIQPPGPVPGMNTETFTFLDPDGWKTVVVGNEEISQGTAK